jgi:methionyl-tRNA formyltransferase
MKVVLMGKGDLAIKVANWLKENYTLIAVVPDIPEPSWSSSLIEWCESTKTDYIKSGEYTDINNPESVDLIISVFYGKIIKKDFIEKCNNIINLHNAPLPKYRGVRPINWALKNNEKEHGVTIHKVTPGIDDGPILGKIIYPIYPEIEEVIDVYEKALNYGWLLFLDVMSKYDYIINNTLPQDEIISTYYSKKDDIKLKERNNFRRNG